MRDEALVMGLGDKARVVANQALLFEEFIAREARAGRFQLPFRPAAKPVLLHGHCHQKAFGAVPAILDVLRLIPGLDVWRPCDTAETAVAWACAIESDSRPSALLLSRQNLPYAPKPSLTGIKKGAYVLAEPSEVGLKKKALGL